MKSRALVFAVLVALFSTGCGGGKSSTPPPGAFTISAAITGLTGTGLVLQDNGRDSLPVSGNGTFPFATQVSSYNVAVSTQPTGQSCTVSNPSGTASANVTVAVTCSASSSTFTISAAVAGLTGGGTLVLSDNVGDQLSFTSNTTLTFATAYQSGQPYTVSGVSQPTGEFCTLGSNSTGTITANVTVAVTCAATAANFTISATVTGLASGTLKLQDDLGDQLTFTGNTTQGFVTQYASGASYTVSVASQPAGQLCTLGSNASGTITSNITVTATCTPSGGPRPLGTVSGVTSVSCSGSVPNGACQQLTVSCPGVPDLFAYVKTNTPTGSPVGTVTYNVGTDGNGLYDSIFTNGQTAVQNVLNAGFTTVQISWGTPFNTNQPGGWVQGPGGVLAAACRYATVTKWIYDNIQSDTSIPMCATGNSGGAGALGYALSQYGSGNVLSMAEVTSGPMTARLDWGCGCMEGSKTAPVPCGSSSSVGTCFGASFSPVWDPAYTPNAYCSDAAINGNLPPGGLSFFLNDSAEAPGVVYSFPKTHVNVLFGGADASAAIPIAMDWYNNITTSKTQGCLVNGIHSIANTLAGAQQIANDLIGMCKLQP